MLEELWDEQRRETIAAVTRLMCGEPLGREEMFEIAVLLGQLADAADAIGQPHLRRRATRLARALNAQAGRDQVERMVRELMIAA